MTDHSIEDRLQVKEDRDTRLRDTSGEVIAELRAYIKKLDSQQGTQAQLSECIVELRKDNARLNEQNHGREDKISELNSQIGNIRCELEACRGSLNATVNELNQSRAISAQEPCLRAELRDLQEICSGLKAEVESTNNETERTKSGLQTSEEFLTLLQENIKVLKDTLQQAEAKISGFEKEKKAYIQTCKIESENQRLQTERDLNQRLEEQKEDHISLVSGLRRQKADAEEKKSIVEGKLDALQVELSKSQIINSDLERLASDLQAEVAALEIHACGHGIEASRFEGELESFQERHTSVAAELQVVRELIHQCIDDTNKIAEETNTKFEKLEDLTGTQLHKIKENNQAEVKCLKEEVASLQEQAGRYLALQDSVSRYLRAKGILGPGDSIDKLATGITIQSTVKT
jgi:chromosome segregation ATPase